MRDLHLKKESCTKGVPIEHRRRNRFSPSIETGSGRAIATHGPHFVWQCRSHVPVLLLRIRTSLHVSTCPF